MLLTLWTIPAAVALAAPPSADGWLVFGRGEVDAFCVRAYDAISGALISGCDRRREDQRPRRAATESVSSIGDVTITRREYDDPAYNVSALKKDIGEDDQCHARELIADYTPAQVCAKEIEYVLLWPQRSRFRCGAIICSSAQSDRVDAFVRYLALGPEPAEAVLDLGPTRPIERARLQAVGESALEEVLRQYGPPRSIRPRYPDGVVMIWPLTSEGLDARVVLGPGRQILSVSVACP